MNPFRLLLTLSALLFSVAAHAAPITYDLVPVGNPGMPTTPQQAASMAAWRTTTRSASTT